MKKWGLLALAVTVLAVVAYAVVPTGSPTLGIHETEVNLVGRSASVLVPSGSSGFFIQPQTSGKTIRVGFGSGSSVSETKGVVLEYLDSLGEQVRPSMLYHEVRAVSTDGTPVKVWVVYYHK